MTTRDPRFQLLEGPALALAKVEGFDASVKLMVNFGGQRLYVPKKMRPRRGDAKKRLNEIDFVGALGMKSAKALAELFGGEHIDIPRGTALTDAQRQAQIENFPGSINEAVKAFDVSRRTVIRNRHGKADKRQQSLFDALLKSV